MTAKVYTTAQGRKIDLGALQAQNENVRAVGNILSKNYNKNIPCHRVIRSDGGMGGYNRGIKNKIAILKKEGAL
jgi:O-6-methylguanine DNA methyltransferase